MLGIDYCQQKNINSTLEELNMRPFVREYINEEQLKTDVNKLQASGVAKEDIYILTHDNDRTDRLVDVTESNKIGMKEMDFGSAVGNIFNSRGDELRNKIEEIGFSSAEAENYEEDLDDGKVLLFVTNNDNVENFLL